MYMLCVMGVPSRNVQKREPPPWGTACAVPYLLDLQDFHLHRPAVLQPDNPVAAGEGGSPVRDKQKPFVPQLLSEGAQQQPERREFPDAALPHDATFSRLETVKQKSFMIARDMSQQRAFEANRYLIIVSYI